MTTSGVTSYNETALQLITDALMLIGVYQSGEAISTEDYNDSLRVLNKLTKNLATHANLWVTKDVTVTLTPGKQSYTIAKGAFDINEARPLRITSARRQNSAGVEIKVRTVSRDEYMMLPVKSTQAPVLQVYYDPQLSSGVVYVWPTGSIGDATLILTVKRPIEDFTAAGDTPDFPQELLLPLTYALAVDLAPIFTGSIPPTIKARCDELLINAGMFDSEPESFSFGVCRR